MGRSTCLLDILMLYPGNAFGFHSGVIGGLGDSERFYKPLVPDQRVVVPCIPTRMLSMLSDGTDLYGLSYRRDRLHPACLVGLAGLSH